MTDEAELPHPAAGPGPGSPGIARGAAMGMHPTGGGARRDDDVDDHRRTEIATDLAHTVLAETSRRLAEAMAEYEAALDRRVVMSELQFFDRAVARAGSEHDAARRLHAPLGLNDDHPSCPRHGPGTA